MKDKVILAGGSGYLGSVLAASLMGNGHEIVVLTRTPRQGSSRYREVGWDGATVGNWQAELEGARGLINLAGASVNCRYHARNRKRILDSRLAPTRALGEAIGRCVRPPAAWLNASTATIYRHTFDPGWDESGQIGATLEAKDAFSVMVAVEWERVFHEAPTPGVRKVALRSAMVLGHGQNSVLPQLTRLARFGLGGTLAGGRQYVSWIHEEDFCRAVEWLIGRDHLCGTVNLSAPNPVTNSEFMAAIRRVCRVPFGLSSSHWMLEIGAFLLRTETELLIKSRRVRPSRLLADGFVFRHPHLLSALEDLVEGKTPTENQRMKP